MDLPVDAPLKVAFAWNLSNLDEMVRDQQLGESYGEVLQREGVPDAWRFDWVPSCGTTTVWLWSTTMTKHTDSGGKGA